MGAADAILRAEFGPVHTAPTKLRRRYGSGVDTIKGRDLIRTGWASICVDDKRPPFSFVTVSGPVTVSTDLREMLPWLARIAGRYMGEHVADQYGRRNAVDGELLVRLRAEHVVAVSHVADSAKPGARATAIWNNGAAGPRAPREQRGTPARGRALSATGLWLDSGPSAPPSAGP